MKLRIGNNGREEFKRLANNFFDETGKILPDAYAKFEVFIQAAKTIDPEFRCYGDALDFIIDERDKEKRSLLIGRKYSDKTLDDLLTVHLYPYQKEGTCRCSLESHVPRVRQGVFVILQVHGTCRLSLL